MKGLSSDLAFWLLITIFFAVNASASVLYVDLNSSNPTPPYAGWDTAAADIQSAIDAASDGDQILVTNGVYATGGRVVYGSLTNRVVINKAVTVQSVNGPAVTVIQGYQIPGTLIGDAAVRCVYMTNNAALIGFTLTNGATSSLSSGYYRTNEQSGGGLWCESLNSFISNCIVTCNSCAGFAAGVYSGTLNNCQIINNTNLNNYLGGGGGVSYSTLLNSTISGNSFGNAGAGAYSCTLSNCIVIGNFGGGVLNCTLDYCTIKNNTNGFYNGGGAYQSTLNHCVIYNNQTQGNGGGAYNSELNFCTVSNNFATSGGGIFETTSSTNRCGQNNQLIGNTATSYGGGCYVAVYGSYTATNWNFNNWIFTSNSAVRDGGGLYLTPSSSIINYCLFTGNLCGGNGGGFIGAGMTTISNSTFIGNIATNSGGGIFWGSLNNCLVVGNRAGSGGGVYGMISNSVVNNNIAVTNGGGVFYYNTGNLILQSKNCYLTNNSAMNGGGAYGGSYSNCVFASNSAVTNGGGVYQAPIQSSMLISNQAAFGGGGYSVDMQNCVVSNNQAGFGGGGYGGSFTNCIIIGNSATNSGGGIYYSGFATNCVIGNNHAAINGGGAYGGTLVNSTLTNNSAGTNGGGTYGVYLTSCILSNNLAGVSGGGTYYSTMNNCILVQNSAVNGGGTYGEYNRSVIGCLFAGNTAAYGGGAYGCNLNNSTLVNNTATNIGGGNLGAGSITSCIIYDNSAPSGANYSTTANPLGFCCTTPLPSGNNNNITNDPVFVNLATGNYRLQTNSPCINTGYAVNAGATDLDGRPRFVGNHIDIGAYEFQGAGIGEFIAWLQQYGLPTNGSADYKDSDGDGLNNWQEWIAGTNPTNAASVLKLAPPSNNVSGLLLTWQSVTNVTYYLQSSTNLAAQPAFTSIQSNLVGQASSTSYTDTTATNGGPYFYRVGVQ